VPILSDGFYRPFLDHFRDVETLRHVVERSMPIPYFGNLSAYLESPIRVLTVALNPSHSEFPKNTAPRFDVTNALNSSARLETELSSYFYINPYSWFRSFEPVLNGLGASYGGKFSSGNFLSTALHVDLCSPIATSPTWSKLSGSQKMPLLESGIQLYRHVISELKPRLILASVAKPLLSMLEVSPTKQDDWRKLIEYKTAINSKPMRVPIEVSLKDVMQGSLKMLIIANGSAAQTPFGRFHLTRKLEVGAMLRELF
jgi:hypothetical protein